MNSYQSTVLSLELRILQSRDSAGERERMYRDDSPDYSAPMARRFSPLPRDLSPSYSPPRQRQVSRSRSPVRDQQRRSTSRRSRSPRVQDHRWRSRSPDRRFKRERSFSPIASGSGGGGDWETDLSREDEEILRSLHCRRCAVTLHDRESMMAHIKVRSDQISSSIKDQTLANMTIKTFYGMLLGILTMPRLVGDYTLF